MTTAIGLIKSIFSSRVNALGIVKLLAAEDGAKAHRSISGGAPAYKWQEQSPVYYRVHTYQQSEEAKSPPLHLNSYLLYAVNTIFRVKLCE